MRKVWSRLQGWVSRFTGRGPSRVEVVECWGGGDHSLHDHSLVDMYGRCPGIAPEPEGTPHPVPPQFQKHRAPAGERAVNSPLQRMWEQVESGQRGIYELREAMKDRFESGRAKEGERVGPFYVRHGMLWEDSRYGGGVAVEVRARREFAEALRAQRQERERRDEARLAAIDLKEAQEQKAVRGRRRSTKPASARMRPPPRRRAAQAERNARESEDRRSGLEPASGPRAAARPRRGT